MIQRPKLREALVPGYLLLCILLGGSSRAGWGNMVLQLSALLLIAWAALRPGLPLTRIQQTFMLLIGTAVTLVVIQLIPLPPDVWTRLPGRQVVLAGFTLLGEPLPWLPVALAPYETIEGILPLLPPLAVLAAMWRLDASRDEWAIAAILAATVCSVLLGYVQLSTGTQDWYFYRYAPGSAVGFFSNRNHMGTLLLVALPLVATLLVAAPGQDLRRLSAKWVTGVSMGVIALAGIAMNGSLAAVVLALPVIAASMLLFGWAQRFRTVGIVVVLAGFVTAVALTTNSPVQGKLTGNETTSIQSRQEIWHTTFEAAKNVAPVGTGLGTFEQVYRLYEDPLRVQPLNVNHAHNDYLELALEGGVPAVLLMTGFLIWWLLRLRDVWRPGGDPLAQAATIASGAILAHSIVDYPLRTSAVAAVFAFCIALMARSPGQRAAPATSRPELRPARHMVIGAD